MSTTNADCADPLTIWLLSPYHTGSHRAWAEGYQSHSRHSVYLLTLSGRFWKWRMQGAALELAAQAEAANSAHPPDLILATDMTNVAAWLALTRRTLPAQVPSVLYMHENQLTYPRQAGQKPDLTYAMINWLSQLCVDRVLFNSEFHRRSWFGELPNLLKHFPDYNHLGLIEQVKARAHVLPVGIDQQAEFARQNPAGAPLILWNQRWEYDKCPQRFFRLLYRLDEAGHNFRLAVAGENFRQRARGIRRKLRRGWRIASNIGDTCPRGRPIWIFCKEPISSSALPTTSFSASAFWKRFRPARFHSCPIVSATRS